MKMLDSNSYTMQFFRSTFFTYLVYMVFLLFINNNFYFFTKKCQDSNESKAACMVRSVHQLYYTLITFNEL